MKISAQRLAILAAFGSVALLVGAFLFQHVGGLHPCKMCLWQRWPHGAAILLGGLALFVPFWGVYLLGGAAAAATAAVGAYHAGVEQGLFEGPTTCTSGAVDAQATASDLLDQILTAPTVRCDEIAWDFAGMSMAGWNGLLSAVLAILWVVAAWRGYCAASNA